jgi:predicted kinase
MKKLFLFRGCPGSGKSTAAEALCENVVSADDYFTNEAGVYKFEGTKIKQAHEYCAMKTAAIMTTGEDVAVANTFTRKWEMQRYYDMAREMGYMVFSMIVENRHEGENVHNVPEGAVQKMRDRFEVVL